MDHCFNFTSIVEYRMQMCDAVIVSYTWHWNGCLCSDWSAGSAAEGKRRQKLHTQLSLLYSAFLW